MSLAPFAIDAGRRLVDLAPKMRAIAGSRLTIDAEIACPRSVVRLDGEQFDAAMLVLVANAAAAGARSIHVRSHMAGARVWVLVGDDGRDTNALQVLHACGRADDSGFCATGFSLVHDFARKSHGHLLVRARPGVGTCFALVLPTVLSVAGNEPLSQPEEKIHEQDRQPVAA